MHKNTSTPDSKWKAQPEEGDMMIANSIKQLSYPGSDSFHNAASWLLVIFFLRLSCVLGADNNQSESLLHSIYWKNPILLPVYGYILLLFSLLVMKITLLSVWNPVCVTVIIWFISQLFCGLFKLKGLPFHVVGIDLPHTHAHKLCWNL